MMDLEPIVVSVGDAAVLLGLSPAKIYELIGEGALLSHKLGRARRISMISIRRYLSATTSAPSSIAQSAPKRLPARTAVRPRRPKRRTAPKG